MNRKAGDEGKQVFDATPYLKLFIDKDGRWFQNGKEIIHTAIYRQFCSMLEKTPEGGYQVRMGREVCGVEAEDAPFVVKGIEDEGDGSLHVRLNDGTTEPFDPEGFWMGKDNIPYCRIRNGSLHARFSRPAYYQIARHISSDPEGKEFFLELNGRRTPVKEDAAPE
ncbi:MAG: hypothetical protein V1792_11195 [Pseudomonadota bacterium]